MTESEMILQLSVVRTRAESTEPGSWIVFTNGRAFLREWIVEACGRVIRGELHGSPSKPNRPRSFEDTLDVLNYTINNYADFADVDRAFRRAEAARKRAAGFNTSPDIWKHRQGVDDDGQEVVEQPDGTAKRRPRAQGEFQW